MLYNEYMICLYIVYMYLFIYVNFRFINKFDNFILLMFCMFIMYV